jgi:hypothetical protein
MARRKDERWLGLADQEHQKILLAHIEMLAHALLNQI